jgi:hypothetical protein
MITRSVRLVLFVLLAVSAITAPTITARSHDYQPVPCDHHC